MNVNDTKNTSTGQSAGAARSGQMPTPPAAPDAAIVETGIAGPRRIGLTIVFVVFGVFGLWSALAPIEGAAFAPGIIKVKSYNKVIQHLEGGIVKSINIQNGDQVEAGDVLLVMDSTQPLAELEILSGQSLTLSALEARLLAERNGLDTVAYPALLLEAGAPGQIEIEAQNQIFLTRRTALDGSSAVLQQRIGQLESRLDGLRALLDTKRVLARSFEEELVDFRALLQEGFTDKQRLRELERAHAQSSGEAAELTATIASTEVQIGETRLQMLQEQNEFQDQVANQLSEVQTQLKEIRDRIVAISHIVSRTDVRAPISGVVNALQVHTEGAVISPGTPIAEVVPQGESLVIEASVSPNDIDRVAEGQEAIVRMSVFSRKTVPTLHGTVINLSADAAQDQNTGAYYYLARIELTPESLEALQDLQLIPGMPAEVFISTGGRTFLQYLLKPLSNGLARSLIED